MQLKLTTRKKWWWNIAVWATSVYCEIRRPSEEKLDEIANWVFVRSTDIHFMGKKLDLRVKSASSNRLLTYFGDTSIIINSIDFSGSYSNSRSSKFVIGWSDFDSKNGRGGFRNSGHGRYVVYDSESDVIVIQGDNLQRPNDGLIANNGIFSLIDFHFGKVHSNTFYVFSEHGDVLFKRKFTANIFKSGLSENGLYAACQTANSRTDDGSKLFFLDIKNNHELFRRDPTYRQESFDFDEEKCELIVSDRVLGKIRYAANGDLIDSLEDQEANLNSDHYQVVITNAECIVKQPLINMNTIRRILEAVVRARSLGADMDETWKPTALKVQGLAHEILGEYAEAIDVFEEALRLNPRIGIKKKMDLLKRKLKSRTPQAK